jgi:hypothetical protein
MRRCPAHRMPVRRRSRPPPLRRERVGRPSDDVHPGRPSRPRRVGPPTAPDGPCRSRSASSPPSSSPCPPRCSGTPCPGRIVLGEGSTTPSRHRVRPPHPPRPSATVRRGTRGDAPRHADPRPPARPPAFVELGLDRGGAVADTCGTWQPRRGARTRRPEVPFGVRPAATARRLDPRARRHGRRRGARRRRACERCCADGSRWS